MCASSTGYNGAAKGTRILFLNTEILPAISSLPVVNQYYERMLPWKPASILTIRYPRCLADMEATQLAIVISSADTSQQHASQPAATAQTEAIAPVAAPYKSPRTIPRMTSRIDLRSCMNRRSRQRFLFKSSSFMDSTGLNEKHGLTQTNSFGQHGCTMRRDLG